MSSGTIGRVDCPETTMSRLSDTYAPAEAKSVVLVWHGRGSHERSVMRPLAEALCGAGVHVIVPDWDCVEPDHGASALESSYRAAYTLAERLSVPLLLLGWSLGGTAALSVALGLKGVPSPSAVIGLAAATDEVSPFDGVPPMSRLEAPEPIAVPVFLVHGTEDSVVPSHKSARFAELAVRSGLRCDLSLVLTDHAGVIGAVFDPVTRTCVPSTQAEALDGLAAALLAVERARTSAQ